MGLEIKAIDHEHKTVPLVLNSLPDHCPVCSRHIRPLFVTAHLVSTGFRPLNVAFLCPVEDCSAMFIGIYSVTSAPPDNSLVQLTTTQLLRHVKDITFPLSVQEISPSFCEIYNQAHQAEANKLDQITGPGYRKALEFLVKDFLVGYQFKDNEEKRESVLKAQLGNCISNFISEERIKSVAKRAAWLGNDETHYYRKWIDKDISDLKTLISMTVSWIDLLIQSDKYSQDMSDKGV